MSNESELILIDQIEPLILEIRGQKVVLASFITFFYHWLWVFKSVQIPHCKNNMLSANRLHKLNTRGGFAAVVRRDQNIAMYFVHLTF